MPLYLEIIFETVGLSLSILGIIFGAKALISVQNKNIQKTKGGVNLQDNRVNNGFTADYVVNIIQSFSPEDIQKIKDEMTKKFEEIDKELSKKTETFVGKDEPINAKEGDIWFDTSV